MRHPQRCEMYECDEPAHVAIDVPDPDDEQDHPTDEHHDQDAADDDPEQRPPKGSNHPAVMAVEQVVVLAALHVVDDEADDAREAGDGADQVQHVRDERKRAIGLEARSFHNHVFRPPAQFDPSVNAAIVPAAPNA